MAGHAFSADPKGQRSKGAGARLEHTRETPRTGRKAANKETLFDENTGEPVSGFYSHRSFRSLARQVFLHWRVGRQTTLFTIHWS